MAKRKKTPALYPPDDPLATPPVFCSSCHAGPLPVFYWFAREIDTPFCERCYRTALLRRSPKAIQAPTNPERG